MAMVHPSRMGLVPQEPPRRRSNSPRRGRSPTPDRRRRSRSRSQDRHHDRRRSPDYSAYTRPSQPQHGDTFRGDDGVSNDAPWRQQQGSMYPNRQGRQTLPPNGGYGANGDYFDSRRQQRDTSTLSIWPSSPKPARNQSSSPSRDKKSKSSKQKRSYSSDEDSSEEERRARKKEKKRAKRDRGSRKERARDRDRDDDRSSRKENGREERSSRRRDRDSEDHSRSRDRDRRRRRSRSTSEVEERDRHKSRRSHSRSRSPPRSPSPSRSPISSAPPTRPNEDEDEWVEKPSAALMPPPSTSPTLASSHTLSESRAQGEDESDDDLGPQPLHKPSHKQGRVDERQYGGALLRGEGSAMAAFLQSEDGTDARIPRRGEIGLTSDEIEQYETVGYVMSGSRHRRMNAVRIRKENQVISAEERRGILKLQKEERERRETVLREEFEKLVDDRLKERK